MVAQKAARENGIISDGDGYRLMDYALTLANPELE